MRLLGVYCFGGGQELLTHASVQDPLREKSARCGVGAHNGAAAYGRLARHPDITDGTLTQ